MTKTLRLDEDRQRDLTFLSDPGEWPRWPVCPVKRRNGNFHEPNSFGFVYADRKPVVYFCNIFALPKMGEVKTWSEALARVTKKEYPDLDTLVDVWTVD